MAHNSFGAGGSSNKTYDVESIVGKNRKSVEGVMDIDTYIDGGWICNRGDTFTTPPSDMYTEEYRRSELGKTPTGNWHKP